MSARERFVGLTEQIPDGKLATAYFWLLQLLRQWEEEQDDAFCEQLYQEFLADPDAGKWEGVPIEEFAAQLGVVLADERLTAS